MIKDFEADPMNAPMVSSKVLSEAVSESGCALRSRCSSLLSPQKTHCGARTIPVICSCVLIRFVAHA